MEIFWKNGRFSGRIWPDWGNTARVDMAGLGSIGINHMSKHDLIMLYNKNIAMSMKPFDKTHS